MPSLDAPRNLAYVKNVSKTIFFKYELDFYSWMMNLCDIKRLGVSGSHYARDKSIVVE